MHRPNEAPKCVASGWALRSELGPQWSLAICLLCGLQHFAYPFLSLIFLIYKKELLTTSLCCYMHQCIAGTQFLVVIMVSEVKARIWGFFNKEKVFPFLVL